MRHGVTGFQGDGGGERGLANQQRAKPSKLPILWGFNTLGVIIQDDDDDGEEIDDGGCCLDDEVMIRVMIVI